MNGLKHHLLYLALFSLCISPARLNANPNGSVILNGSASFNQQGNTLTITNTPGTIINWQDFSIQSDETTRFIQQSVDSTVLNRVVGQDPSQILGKLQSNGRVFLINPNGILFGSNSVIDVNGLVASTLNLSNENFISNQLNFNGDGTNGAINNQGTITTAEGGFIYLIAPDIENHGVITSPKGEVILAAGHSVQLVSSDDPNIRVTLTASESKALNVGEIITRGGKMSIYAGLINQQGIISADSAVLGENGKIFFKASTRTTLSSSSITTANGVNGGNIKIETTQGLTEVSGKVTARGENGKGGEVLILGEHVGILDNANIDASGLTAGGTVLIGGDNKGENPNVKNAKATYVGVNTQIHADALEEGNGGKVIIWSDDATRAYGTITAKGGSVFGNGGFVETSGGYLDVAGLNLDVTANNGDGGTWLLDPYNITITNTTTVNVTGAPNYTPTATGSNIFNGDINAALDAGTSVIIDTTGGGAELGNITVDAAITKTTGPLATLTLKAHNNIVTNAAITASGGSMHVVLTADQDTNGIGAVTLNSNITTLGGNVTITSAGDITLNSGTNTIIAANATVSLTSTNGLITGDPAGAPKDIVAGLGTINLTAKNGIYANSGSAPLYVDAANINFTNNTTGLVRIYNNHVGAETVSGSHNGTGNIILESFDTTNPFNVGNVTENNGYISFRTGTMNITGPINAGTNTVYMMPYLASAVSVDGTQTFDVTSAEIANITAGNIFIGKDTLANEATTADIAISAASNLGGKNVWLVADNGVTVGNNGVTNTGGQFYIDNVTSGNIITGTGNITSDFIQFRSVGEVQIGSGGVTSTATGNVYFSAADIDINGAVNTGANSLYLYPYLSNTAVSVGGAQTFNLIQTDFSNISASTVYVGYNGSSTYASTFDLTSSTTVDVGGVIFNAYSTGNTTIGANNLSATGGNLQFYGSGVGVLTFGSGQTTSSTLYTTGFNAIITGAGNINSNTFTLNAGDTITIGSGGITTGAGGATLSATNGILQNGNISASSTGTINLTSSAGYINMASTALSSTNGGNITYNANTNATLGRLNTGATTGAVSVTASTGSITDVGAAAVNIYASSATLNAATGIGNTGFDVFFNNLGTTNLTASTSTGNIIINSTSAMNVGTVTASSGSVSLSTTGGTSYLTTTSNVSGNGVSLDSSQNLTIGSGGITSAGNLSLTSAGVLSQAGNLVTTSGGITKIIANSATLNNITSAGNVEIETDQITIANTIDAGGNNVYIMPRNLNPISIDGTETFDLTQGELSNITNFSIVSIGSNGTTTRATTASISSSASTTVGSGAASGIIRALNDITFGSNNFSAIGANMTFTSDNGNIITGIGNILAGSVTFNAANDITVGSGGITSTGTTSLTATNNMYLDILDAGTTGDITLSAGGSINDSNGDGVVNVKANNLTVSSGGNASLDYQIVGALASAGVVGTADLRVYPVATTTTTTATAPSSTNEPLTTSIDTISDTTNSLSTDVSLTSTLTTTAPLEDSSTSETTTSPTDDSTQTSTNTTEESTATSESETEEDSKEEQAASSEKKDEKESPKTAKKLPICK